MKSIYSKMMVAMLLVGSGFTARADGGQRPDPAKFRAAIKACESSSYNVNGVTFPEPPAPGQRPELNTAQRELIQACEQAGILPRHPHGRRGERRGDQQVPPVEAGQ